MQSFQVSPDQYAEWDDFVTSRPDGSHWQLGWWLEHHQRRFAQSRIIAVRDGGRIIAGAGYYRFGLPWGVSVIVLTNAPIVADPLALPPLMDALRDAAGSHRSMLLQFEAFDPRTGDAIADHFSGCVVERQPIWKLYHPGIWREIRIPLANFTPPKLLKHFSRLVGRQVKKAEEAHVEVAEVTDDESIRIAHDIWVESGQRKHYVLRSFPDFRALVRKSLDRHMGVLLLARVEGEPASFLYSLFYGTGAVALHTGFTDKHAEIPCNRLLHWRTMLMAMERGIPYLSLAAPGRDGVRQFKDHFHPEMIDNTRFITVILKPLQVAAARPFIGNTAWMNRLKSFVTARERARPL